MLNYNVVTETIYYSNFYNIAISGSIYGYTNCVIVSTIYAWMPPCEAWIIYINYSITTGIRPPI